MKANELRIGNYLYNGQGYVVVDEIYLNEIKVTILEDSPAMFEECEIQPIPLTEEWLEKFGFRKIADYSFCLDEFLTLEVEDGDYENLCLDVYIENATTVHPVYITCLSYTHQLQNLYFALKGEELEIK